MLIEEMKEKCPNIEDNLKFCTCTYGACNKKGLCCQCIAYHRKNGEIPGCLFPKEAEATFDRSIRNFIKSFK